MEDSLFKKYSDRSQDRHLSKHLSKHLSFYIIDRSGGVPALVNKRWHSQGGVDIRCGDQQKMGIKRRRGSRGGKSG